MKRVVEWLREGFVAFSKHAREEMAKDGTEATDIENVLRCGSIHEEGEFENGSWRYRVRTSKFVVVVAFSESEKTIRVVTTWRLKKGR